MSFKEFLLVFIVAFIAFGFLRRFLYYNALQSFRKAADDLERERSQKGNRQRPGAKKKQGMRGVCGV